MHKFIKICLFAFLLFHQKLVNAQEPDWINDSLSIYHKMVTNAISENDFDASIKLNKVIAQQGYKSLNPKVYDYFYAQSKLTAYNNQPQALANIYKYIGNLEFHNSNYELAKNAFNEAIKYFKRADDTQSAAGMAMNLAILIERSGDFDSAIFNYKKALTFFEKLKDTSSISLVFENLSLAFMLKGQFDSAVLYINKVDSVLQHSTPVGSQRWISLYYNKGSISKSMSVFDKALDFTFQGLRLSEELKSANQINKGYSLLTDIYSDIKDTINQKKYTHLARKFATTINDKSRMAQLDFDLGNLFLFQLKMDSAVFYAERGMELSKDIKTIQVLINGNLLLSNIKYRQRDFLGSINILEHVINNYPLSKKKDISGIYHNLGNAHMEVGNFIKSNEYLGKSLALALEINMWDRLVETYETLSINSKRQGDFREALAYYELYKQYEDSIFNETKSKQIAEVQTQYETEKKDQSIAALEQEKEIQILEASRQQSQIYLSLSGLLIVLIIAFVFYYQSRIKQKANKALEAKNAEIEEQNKEKEMLLKEIHHRVKNNLQIISSLLSMQSRNLSDSKTIDAMKESQSRVKTMALIHEKLYQYDNLARINMNEYMQQLSNFLTQTYRSEKEIDVVIDSEDINLDIDTAVPLGLITNELLSNALKYAFEDMEKGQINIHLSTSSAGNYTLTISDTGKGLAADMDIEKSKSLGLKLVRTLTRQINGNLSITSNPGATFSIAFNENQVAA